MVRNERNPLGRGMEEMLKINPKGHNNSILELPLNEIIIRKNQPRKIFEESALIELSNSIKEHGVLQPILVRPLNGKYEIIAGERRYRAAKNANLSKIPVIVKDISEDNLSQIALIENIQRENLNSLEEAEAFSELSNKYNLTHEEIAERLGKSRVYITNALRLLQLPTSVQNLIKNNSISAGHARSLLRIENSELQLALADKIINNGISVRQTEELIRNIISPKKEKEDNNVHDKNKIFNKEIEEKLQVIFGGKIKLVSRGKGGKIEIFYQDNDELSRFLEIIGYDK